MAYWLEHFFNLLIRENPEILKKALKNRGADFDVDYLLELDQKRRLKIKEVDDLRARQNALAEEGRKKLRNQKALKHNSEIWNLSRKL